MSPLVTEALQKAYGFALAKSSKAIQPIEAITRAAVIVGNIEGAPACVRELSPTALYHPSFCELKTSKCFLDWYDADDNRAKVEAVALALTDGRLGTKSCPAAISEIIRSADTRLGLPEFEIPDAYPALQKLGLGSPRLVSALADAYIIAWDCCEGSLSENARIASGDYEEYDPVAWHKRFYEAHERGEIIAVIRAMLRGRLCREYPNYCHWHEFASSARALFRIADALVDRASPIAFGFDDDGNHTVSADVEETVSSLLGDDMGVGLPTDDPVTRQVARYIAAVNERMYPIYRAMIPNLQVDGARDASPAG